MSMSMTMTECDPDIPQNWNILTYLDSTIMALDSQTLEKETGTS